MIWLRRQPVSMTVTVSFLLLQLFVATQDKSDPRALAQAWRAFVTGEIREVLVDTYHLGMADPQSLEVIGPELSRALDAADAAFPAGPSTDR